MNNKNKITTLGLPTSYNNKSININTIVKHFYIFVIIYKNEK